MKVSELTLAHRGLLLTIFIKAYCVKVVLNIKPIYEQLPIFKCLFCDWKGKL